MRSDGLVRTVVERPARLAWLVLGLTLGACGGGGGVDRPPPTVSPEEAARRAGDAARRIARSIWGVVPNALDRKQDLPLGAVRGSAVAVSADSLLVSCRAVPDRQRVGLLRQNKYRIARVTATDAAGEVCVLTAPDAPLLPAGGFRGRGGLRPGETVYAIASRDSFDTAVAAGTLEAAPGGRLQASLGLPEGMLSAVLFDAVGDVVGIAGGPTTQGAPVRVAPVAVALVPRLNDSGPGRPGAPVAPRGDTPKPVPFELPDEGEG